MTKSFENMLWLFCEGATGKSPGRISDVNAEEIRRYSIEQGIWSIVYEPLGKYCDVSAYEKEFFHAVTDGIRRTQTQLDTLCALAAQGIECVLLKGGAVARLYKNPECRISSDTDILIDPGDEAAAATFLRENGYKFEPRPKNEHHLRAYHPVGGLLEVHVSLYSVPTARIVFRNKMLVRENPMTITVDGREIKTLGVNDGLVYLTAHMIKHMVNNNCGIRQIMDLLLYMRHYEDSIDWTAYNSLLRELSFDKLTDVIKMIGNKYFGFDFGYCTEPEEELAELVLDDIEKLGLFAKKSAGVSSFYNEFYKARTSLSGYEHMKTMYLQSEVDLLKKLFPPKSVLLRQGFGCAKYTALVPAAWVHRLFAIFCGRLSNSAKPQYDAETADRMNMMKKLGVID